MQQFDYLTCVVTARELTGTGAFLAERGEEPCALRQSYAVPGVSLRVRMAGWGEGERESGVTEHPPPGRGTKWTPEMGLLGGYVVISAFTLAGWRFKPILPRAGWLATSADHPAGLHFTCLWNWTVTVGL